jgi:hypothetical protein
MKKRTYLLLLAISLAWIGYLLLGLKTQPAHHGLVLTGLMLYSLAVALWMAMLLAQQREKDGRLKRNAFYHLFVLFFVCTPLMFLDIGASSAREAEQTADAWLARSIYLALPDSVAAATVKVNGEWPYTTELGADGRVIRFVVADSLYGREVALGLTLNRADGSVEGYERQVILPSPTDTVVWE